MQVGISRQNGGQVHLERATTQCSGRTEYRGLKQVVEGCLQQVCFLVNPKSVDAMCTVQMGERCLIRLKTHCMYWWRTIVYHCVPTLGSNLKYVHCALVQYVHCAALEPRTRIVNVAFCTVQCALLFMYIMVVEVVCTDLLASLSYLGLYHILLLSADKPSLKDQKTVLPQRSRTKELLFTISDGSYMGQNTRQGNSRS